jgi:predicted dehydrogenase
MAPIRVALIGLSQGAKTSWASDAHLPYLLSERGKKKYKIVALLNSSKEAATKAIQAYALPDGVKAYGSPEELAKDDEVDLVVCTTRVDVHYDTIEPSIKAGKDVFVEWPLAENVKRATELRDLGRRSGSRTMLGLQGRVAPSVVKVKELIEQGVIGRVLSSTLQANTIYGGGNSMREGLAYFLDKKIGGNPVTIALGHSKFFIIECHVWALTSC